MSAPTEAKPQAPVLEYSPSGQRLWRVGSLTYTPSSLSNVFLWMLWGDFCLNLMDSGVIPNVIPLQMRKYGASNFVIGLLSGTVMEILATVMVAIISPWSDRHRGPRGRRMPFILWSTPPLALFLALLGFSPQLAECLKRAAPSLLAGVSFGSLTIGTMSMLMVAYKFCDNFPQSVYYYLWPDVIPGQLMGTFACLFRVFATAGTLLFNWKLIQYADTDPGLICVLAAGLYLFSFLMLVAFVREGEYPPPEPPPPGTFVERIPATVARYLRECFSIGYYWKIYLFNLFFICGIKPFATYLIFYRDTFHIDLARYGHVMMVAGAVQMLIFFALGPIVDRFHPIRAGIAANLLAFVTTLLGFLFTHSAASFMVSSVAIFASIAIFQAATAALGPRVLPQKQYGQFCSANAVVFHIGVMITFPLAGWVLDQIGYRYVYAWFALMTGLSSLMIILMYFDWKKLGGDDHYVAPLIEDSPTPPFQ